LEGKMFGFARRAQVHNSHGNQAIGLTKQLAVAINEEAGMD
jgi:hypothetical protein